MAALTSVAMASAGSSSACSTLERPKKGTSSSLKDELGGSGSSVKQTNLVLFQQPDESMTEAESLERLDYDSENGTDL